MKTAGTLFLTAAGFAFLLLRVPPASRPQAAAGDDALSVAFGDARQTISAALLHKADSYFHGGVDMDGGHHCELDEHAELGHHDQDHASCDQDHGAHADANATRPVRRSSDPWHWINARVRAPQVERHLEGERGVEMIPVLWASVRADPKNVEAWTTAWFIAHTTMKNPELATRILDEGLKLNPDEPELLFTRARQVLKAGKGARESARKILVRAQDVLMARCGGQAEKLSPADAETKRHVDLFLRDL